MLACWDRRDRISAISCITLSPQVGRPGLYFELLPVNETAHAEDVVTFLKRLRRQLRGGFTVVWDRANIHGKSKVVKQYLAGHSEVVAEDFPGYTPELNPDEWVWGWAKYGQLSNLAAQDADELHERVVTELVDLTFRPELLNAFVSSARIPVAA